MKSGNTSPLLFVILFLVLALAALFIYMFVPGLVPTITESAKNTVERAADTIDNIGREEQQIEELKFGSLPENAISGREFYDLERETFDEMNKARWERKIPYLEWQEELANVAFLHSKDQAENNYLEHENLQGLTPGDRIENRNILNFCNSENIFFIKGPNSKGDLAQNAVEGWLNSPGHRKNLLDNSIKEAGVGIYCAGRRCYVTANHICTTRTTTQPLEKNFVYFFSIYPEESAIDKVVQVTYDLTATAPVDIYLVPDKEEYQNYVDRKSFLFTKKYTQIEDVSDIASVKKGYGFLFIPSRNSGIQIDIEYL